jgi:hypothetical protein
LRTVSQLNTLLSPYLAVGTQSGSTTTLTMLNSCLPVMYAMGDWRSLKTEYEIAATSGYFCLPPDYEAVLSASLAEAPMQINSIDYQTRYTGPGRLVRPVGSAYGLIDRGMKSLMSDIAEEGIDELIFTCASAAFASGDTATVTYSDTEEGYTQVVLPLHTITVAASGGTAITVAADGGTDATTGEVLTTLTVTSSTGLVAGLGLTISQLTGTDATYIGTFRIHSVASATSIKIVKAYVALTGTLAAVSTPRLMPVSTIESVESIVYESLPGRTLVKDADGIIYADLLAGSGVASYRRYECPQVPEDAEEDDEWTVRATVKRAFIPLTSNSDIVHLDSIPALTSAFLAVVARDASDHEREEMLWARVRAILDKELFDAKGGVTDLPEIQLWGEGLPGMPCYY